VITTVKKQIVYCCRCLCEFQVLVKIKSIKKMWGFNHGFGCDFFFKSGQKLGCVLYMGAHYTRVNIVGLPLPFHNIKFGGNHMFLKVIGLFWKLFGAVTFFFPVTSQVRKTFLYFALVLCVHYTICRYMFTVRFQYNFEQMTASFSARRR